MKDKIQFLIGMGAAILIIAAMSLMASMWLEARNDYNQLNELLADTVNHFEVIVTDQGKTISVQEQRVATLDNAIAAGLVREEELKEKDLKRLDYIVRLENEIAMHDISVDLPDSNLVVISETDTVCPEGVYLKVPADFFYSDEWAKLAGTVNGPDISIRELRMINKPSIFIGYQKQGFFKPLKPVVTVEDANPYVSTFHMENVSIQQKPPFYKRPWWHRLEGAALLFGAQAIINKIE
jgi:hypothetical protein